ncbi:DUF4031 domain-containing protein [Rhizobium sp. ZX09]|uniref:DUF4031 domain-containing protein n=1 Tax=Rhizobium sp. ZX09 TaxID=2291939 RepID=UPI001FEE123D|nr:DUF4031 domain-containing protein [Rhizobium sp. ZX09]
MSVYVDDMRAPFGNMVMCHMWADSDDELLAMADRIGVQRKWIQGHPILSFGKHRNASWVHFDIATSKRALAVKFGAIETDRFGPVIHTTKLRLAAAISAGNDDAVRSARERLASYEAIRVRHDGAQARQGGLREGDFAALADLLCTEPLFHRFLEMRDQTRAIYNEGHASTVLKSVIGIASKTQLNTDERAQSAFIALRTDFDVWKKRVSV